MDADPGTEGPKVSWGILATGKIAHKFAADLQLLPDAQIAAVGSRRQDKAEQFAAAHDIPRAHGSYAALARDETVDVVYVATPHGLHHEDVTMLLEAGTHVLCEKPMTLNSAGAEELFALARERNLFLMEAMWMACHPLIRELVRRNDLGEFGTPHQVTADLGFVVTAPPTDRMLNPDLGGGALLDMGIYPLTFAHLFLGEPDSLTATATLSDQGVDLDVAIAGRYGGAVAALTSSMTCNSPRSATVATDKGRLEIPADFHAPTHAIWPPADGDPERIEPSAPIIGMGYGNEADEVMRCLRAGETESPMVPARQTLSLMNQMDGIRRQIGVAYAADSGVLGCQP